MGLPKKRISRMKRDQRRHSRKMKAPAVNVCPNCKSYKRPHYVCAFCGRYSDRLVLV